MDITAFEHISTSLTHPLVLVGFALMMIFKTHDKLLKVGVIPKLNQRQGSFIVKLILSYGFWLGVLLILLGFGLQYYQAFADKQIRTATQSVETSSYINQIVTTLTLKSQLESQVKDEHIKSLTQAVTALSKGEGVIGTKEQVNAAMVMLAQGNTTEAKSLFTKAAQNAEEEAKEGASALRNLGALAFLDDPQEALQAYHRAIKLEPDDADSWNKLGLLLSHTGELNAAIDAYNRVLLLAENQNDNQKIAWAYGNLGSVYRIRSDTSKALEYHEKAIKLFKEQGDKLEVANEYGNLGLVYEDIGDLDKALESHNKAINLFEEIGNKQSLALDYVNLGVLYKNRGDLDNALATYEKALYLNTDLGNKVGMAAAYGNLGNLYNNRGDLAKAIEFNQKALSLDVEVDYKDGIAADYSGLGRNYTQSGDLDKAIEFHHKALDLHQQLGSKKGMAMDYGNLGIICQQQGNHAKAKHYYQVGIKLLKPIDSASASDMQASLDALK